MSITKQMSKAMKLGQLLSKVSNSWKMRYNTTPEVASEYVIKISKSSLRNLHEELSKSVPKITSWQELYTRMDVQNLANDMLITVQLYLNFDQKTPQLNIEIL